MKVPKLSLEIRCQLAVGSPFYLKSQYDVHDANVDDSREAVEFFSFCSNLFDVKSMGGKVRSYLIIAFALPTF